MLSFDDCNLFGRLVEICCVIAFLIALWKGIVLIKYLENTRYSTLAFLVGPFVFFLPGSAPRAAMPDKMIFIISILFILISFILLVVTKGTPFEFCSG